MQIWEYDIFNLPHGYDIKGSYEKLGGSKVG